MTKSNLWWLIHYVITCGLPQADTKGGKPCKKFDRFLHLKKEEGQVYISLYLPLERAILKSGNFYPSDVRFAKKFVRIPLAQHNLQRTVFTAYALDPKPIAMAPEKHAANKDKNKVDAATAQSLVNNIFSLKTTADLADIADICDELRKIS